ncbi:MAG: hypothetical protein DRJ47_08630 [Thermoprotei archaeon]|nr:MAG: hypothetical protein DRJ47_08630 [Thermoprotei archaeon]
MAKWTEEDDEILRKLYPTYDIDVILEALGGRFSWHAIRIRASLLGLKRIGRGGSRGESKYEGMAYCSKCSKWIPKEKVKNYRCPYCGRKVRFPGPLSYRRKRKWRKEKKE